MNIEQWISCIAEAYETAGEAFSSRKKEILLEELPEDSPSIDQATRLSIEAGIIPKPIEIQDESLNNVIDETKELVIRYFFKKFTLGETFGSIARVEQHFGRSLENNYDISSGPFIDMAKTYWAYQLEVRDLFPKYHNLVLAQVLVEVESRIGSVFFPFPGPIILWVRGRRETQRELLEDLAPEIDIDAFLEEYPDGNVISHPESSFEVCQKSEFVGSTEYIIDTISKAPSNTQWLVGTELNLVNRLAMQNKADGKIVKFMSPTISMCSTMFRINAEQLAITLESLVDGKVMNQISVDKNETEQALLALERMFEVSP